MMKEAIDEVVKQIKALGSLVAKWWRKRWAKVSPGQQMIAKKIVVAAVVALIAVGTVGALAIYGLGWQGSLAADLADFYHYPAAVINGRWVSFGDYATIEASLAKGNQQLSANQVSSAKQLDQTAFAQLAARVLVDQWAVAHGIFISDQIVNNQVEASFQQAGGDKAGLQILHDQYGLDRTGFAKQVKTYMEETAIAQQLATDTSTNAAAESKAETVLKQAKSGTDFNSLVQQYSQASVGTNGLATLKSGTLPQAVVLAASGVSDGQVVAHVISLNHYYYVVKRTHDASGASAAQVVVLRPETYPQWLAQQTEAAKVFKLLPQTR